MLFPGFRLHAQHLEQWLAHISMPHQGCQLNERTPELDMSRKQFVEVTINSGSVSL